MRLWTIVLEISVLMAQFPSKEIAQLSYEFRTLGLGYANIGGLLMIIGHPLRQRRGPRHLRRADRDHDRRLPTPPRPRWPSELGAFPGYAANREHMLRVIRNHRRAAYGETDGLRGAVDRRRCRSTTPTCPDQRLVAPRASRLGHALDARRDSTATATRRPP